MAGYPAPRRYAATVPFCFSGAEEAWATSRDISETGVFLDTDVAVPEGPLTVLLAWGGVRTECRAEVARVDESGVALRFVEPPVAFRQMLRQIISRSPPAQCHWPGYSRWYYWG